MKITKQLLKQLIKEEIQTEMERPIGDPNRPGAIPKKSQEIYRKLRARDSAMKLSDLLARAGLSIKNINSLIADIMASDGVEPLRNTEGRRAYIREDREAKKPAKPYNITDIQCRPGVSGVSRYILTRKGRKFVEFCPQRSDSQAGADMGTHKRGFEQAFLKITKSPDAFDALAYLENIDHPSWRYYEPLLGPNLKLGDYIAKYDPFAPDTNFIFFQPTDITKENYNKRFDSIMRNVYGLLDPFNNMSPELKKDTDLQKKLGDLYKAVLRFYRHIKEYHKARIAQ